MSEEDWFEQALREDEENGNEDEGKENGEEGGEHRDTPSSSESGEPGAAADAFDDLEGEPFSGDVTDELAGDVDEGDDGDEGLFETNFGEEFAGFDGLEGDDLEPGGSDFAEPIDSDIPRVELGIEGLDEMIQGGVPERALIAVIGTAGTGKTTFGLQFLLQGLLKGERTVFITLEQSRDEILDTAAEFGWDFDEYRSNGDLVIVDLDPIQMANSLGSIQNDLPRVIGEFGATRLVLDSVSLLEMMYEQQAKRRNEIYDFTRSLKESGVTTLLTSEADQSSVISSRFGIVEYLTDAVVTLRIIRSNEFRESRLAIEIQKIRNTNHSREVKPYEIGEDGITVYRQATIF